MSKAYSEELTYATTEDGFLLAGAVIRPAGGPARPVTIVWMHGNAAAFYDSPYILIGRELATLGYPVISGNTRGHDISAFAWRTSGAMPTGGGAAWERLEEAPYDVAAWVEVAAGLGSGGVVLVGHSAGAQKVVLYQAERQDSRIVGVVLASPDLHGFSPPGELEAAQRMVAEGQGMEVLPAQPYAPWYRQSAQTVVSRANVLSRLFTAEADASAIASLHAPLLVFFGARERVRDVDAELAAARHDATSAPRVHTELIEDADHFYTGCEPDAARVIARWVDGLA
jgi:pimeloyl-ACP methyl ester carboxylesterase